MEYYEFIDVVRLIKLHNKYMYDKQYKIDNKNKFNEYSRKYYNKLVSTTDGKLKYNLTKLTARHNKIKQNKQNNENNQNIL